MQWDRYSRKRGSFPHRHPCLLRSQLPLHLPSVLFYSASKPTGNWPETIRIWWFRKATPQSLIYPGILIRLIPSTGFLFRTTRSMILWNPLPRNLLILSGQKSKCPLSWSSTISGKRIIWNLFSCSPLPGKNSILQKKILLWPSLPTLRYTKCFPLPPQRSHFIHLTRTGTCILSAQFTTWQAEMSWGRWLLLSTRKNGATAWPEIWPTDGGFSCLTMLSLCSPDLPMLQNLRLMPWNLPWQIRIGRNWRQSLLLLKIILPWPIRSIFWISQRRLWHQKHSCVLRYTMSWALIFWSFSWFCWSVCSIPL